MNNGRFSSYQLEEYAATDADHESETNDQNNKCDGLRIISVAVFPPPYLGGPKIPRTWWCLLTQLIDGGPVDEKFSFDEFCV